MDHDYKNQIIRHELGHWTTAKSLGFSVGDIMINVSSDRRGGHHASSRIFPMHSFENLNSLVDYLENRIAILYAGFHSQISRIDDTQKEHIDSIRDIDCSDDNSKIRELSIILRGIIHCGNLTTDNEEEQTLAILEKSDELSKKIFEENISIIAMMAPKISRKIIQPSEPYTILYSDLNSWWD